MSTIYSPDGVQWCLMWLHRNYFTILRIFLGMAVLDSYMSCINYRHHSRKKMTYWLISLTILAVKQEESNKESHHKALRHPCGC
jgi:hypothetical protein